MSCQAFCSDGMAQKSVPRIKCRVMFDEGGEIVLHETDLHARLAAALDGPAAWITWDLARAIARNIKFKLEDPPKRPIVTGMYHRAVLELTQLFHAFPRLPEHWMHGGRIDDPSVRCFLTTST